MEYTVSVQSTGRFQTLGDVNENVKSVWFVFHGYGMRADKFITEFDCINNAETLVVAPEGLHRFYSRGTRGNISSSWMTSDLREFDIKNNILFIDSIWELLLKQGLHQETKIGVLGFSQGAPTAIRWAMNSSVRVSQLVIWGSNVPNDIMDDVVALKKLNQSNVKLVIGSDDEYIPEEKVDELLMDLHDQGVDYDFHTFNGTHELHEETIRYFHARLIDETIEY